MLDPVIAIHYTYSRYSGEGLEKAYGSFSHSYCIAFYNEIL